MKNKFLQPTLFKRPRKRLRVDRVITTLFVLLLLYGIVGGFYNAYKNPEEFKVVVLKERDLL